jgi:Domain found in Dishevelled, Egl-10, and Pleckstrin (DEP)
MTSLTAPTTVSATAISSAAPATPINAVPTICLDLPLGIGLSTITAVANAIDVKVKPVTKGLKASVYQLLLPNTLLVLDLSKLKASSFNITALPTIITTAEMRSRVMLTQLNGHVSQGDDAYAKYLGFAGLLADIDPRQPTGGIKVLIDWISKQLHAQPMPLNRLPAYLKTVPIPTKHEDVRSLIQRLTNQPAESLVALMKLELDIADRTYHLKKYPQCFLGNAAMAWLKERFSLSTAQALSVGNTMMQLGLIYHTAHEKGFADEAFFYRLALSDAADKLRLQDVIHSIKVPHKGAGVEVANRTYLTTTYPMCFIGSQAVDFLTHRWAINRLDAWVLMNRIEKLGIFEHVTQEHGFQDGNFFFHFNIQ